MTSIDDKQEGKTWKLQFYFLMDVIFIYFHKF